VAGAAGMGSSSATGGGVAVICDALL